MSVYIDPSGQPTYGIGVCARCHKKFPLAELQPDPNYPNLMVCKDDMDAYDPYRLAPRTPDQIVLPFTRPDAPLESNPSGVITEDGDGFLTTEDGEGYLEF